MNTKRKGSIAEREILNLLKDQGYTGIRSGASLGAADVVVWNDEHIRFIQSKNEGVRVSYAEDIDRLAKMKCPPNGTRELWIRHRGGKWTTKLVLQDGLVREFSS